MLWHVIPNEAPLVAAMAPCLYVLSRKRDALSAQDGQRARRCIPGNRVLVLKLAVGRGRSELSHQPGKIYCSP